MRKTLFAVMLAILLFVPFAVPVKAAQTTRSYGDITTNGWWDFADVWDLTSCDLTISYTLDMSGYVPPMWNTAWSSVGVEGGAWGWMSSGAPAAAQTNPNSLDNDDKLNLGAPGRYDEASYDATGQETLVTPPIGNPWLNFGVWFDRDGVDQWQALMWGMINGKTYNTGGLYEVVVTYHAINPSSGTMFALVNDQQTGFYDSWRDGPPHHYPVGKSISGDLTQLLVFASISGENVMVYGLQAAGCLYKIPATVNVDPDTLNLKSKGNWITAYITLPEAYTVNDIDLASVKLGDVTAAWGEVQGTVLMLKFDRQLVADELAPGLVTLTITGSLTNGQPFTGSDSITVISK